MENHDRARNSEYAQRDPRSLREWQADADTPLVSVAIPCYKLAKERQEIRRLVECARRLTRRA